MMRGDYGSERSYVQLVATMLPTDVAAIFRGRSMTACYFRLQQESNHIGLMILP